MVTELEENIFYKIVSSCKPSLIARIEKAPSHYCRKSLSKIYLEPLVKTKNQLYKLYCTAAEDAALTPLSKRGFKRWFDSSNYSLVKPKKDMCDLCLRYRVGNVTQSDSDAHILSKERALAAKQQPLIQPWLSLQIQKLCWSHLTTTHQQCFIEQN